MATKRVALVSAAGVALAPMTSGQLLGNQPEVAPSMTVMQCNDAACWPEQTQIVMDMNWRWLHDKAGNSNCLGDKGWDKTLCPDPDTCAKNCALEGVDASGYSNTYKAQVVDNSLHLAFPEAPRVYMTDLGGEQYKMYKLLNREFSFDVDLSSLPCGLNTALYFIEMPLHGAKFHSNNLNQGGAKYGTGYCDAQCPHMKFIRGEANTEQWRTHTAKNPDGDILKVGPEGRSGICCAELDLLEANTMSGAFTAHPCKFPADATTEQGDQVCQGDKECGNKDKGELGWCDKNGCGFNSWRMGDEKFWGPGQEFKVDTTKIMKVVTQFITTDGTDAGDLKEIRRLYIQDGKVIENSKATNLPKHPDSLTDDLCAASVKKYNETYWAYDVLGGLKGMGESMRRGMVLSLSIWDDDFGRMLWLDANRPSIEYDAKDPGVSRGPCPFKKGSDADIKAGLKKKGATAVAIYSNIWWGTIGSAQKNMARDAAIQGKAEVVAGDLAPPAASALPTFAAGVALAAAAAAAAALAFARSRLAAGRAVGEHSPILQAGIDEETVE